MSRHIKIDDGLKQIRETIESMSECKHLINEICTNDLCDQCYEFVDPEYCQKCPCFTKEDGVPFHHH